MIVTVTTNPGIDRTYRVPELQLGEVNRARGEHAEASGKGVNVTRVLHAAEARTCALLTSGGVEGRHLTALLEQEGIACRAVAVSEPTRTNINILDSEGCTTKVNGPGSPLSTEDSSSLLAELDSLAVQASWVVCSGSLPVGTDPTLQRDLIETARARGAKVAVDASGAALNAAVEAKPDLVTPNSFELAELVGRDLPDLSAVREAAREISATIEGQVLVSMGSEGALCVSGPRAWLATPAPIEPVSTAGAGDALLAGWLFEDQRQESAADIAACLARGVAWGTAACRLAETAGNVAPLADPGAVTIHILPEVSTAATTQL